MKIKEINTFVEKFAKMCGHKFSPFDQKDIFITGDEYVFDDKIGIIDELIKKSNTLNLSIIESSINIKDFDNFLNEVHYSFISLVEIKKSVKPVIFEYVNSTWNVIYLENNEFIKVDVNTVKKFLLSKTDNKDDVLILSPVSLNPLVSDDDKYAASPTLSPMRRLFKLLANEKKDIVYIYIYALTIGLITLSLPLGIQAIISLISGGLLVNNVILLIALVIIGTILAGWLQIMQISLVETLQRRVFAKAAFEFTYRIPKVKSESILNAYPPELMNRFFDILQIQKGLPKLLIDLSAAFLQIAFGMILLAIYHPLFIVFGLLLMIFLVLVFYLTGPKGLKSSLIESKYKYKIAHWLEELARTLVSFKLAGFTNLPLQKMDYYLNGYLNARKVHFKILINQFANIVVFKTLVTGGLLIMGSLLVVDKQISLGQFVASEIVIILIINAVEKFVLSLDVIYDLLTAVEKIGNVTDLPLEKTTGVIFNRNIDETGIKLEVKKLSYKYPESQSYILKDVSFEIAANENVCIAGVNGAGKNTLIQILSGILESYQGSVSINNLSIRDINLNSLRDVVGRYNSKEDIFEGTVYENISMGIARTTMHDIMWAVEKVGLLDWLHQLPQGLSTPLIAGGKGLNNSIIKKIILARAIAEKPNLLITTDFLGGFEKKDKMKIINLLLDKENQWSLLSISNDPAILSCCDKILLMNEGSIVAQGTYEEMKKHELFKNIILS